MLFILSFFSVRLIGLVIQLLHGLHDKLSSSSNWHKLLEVLETLSERPVQVPPQLYLLGVSCSKEERETARKEGGFSDIYLGKYRDKDVALKLLRNFEAGNARVHKVSPHTLPSAFSLLIRYLVSVSRSPDLATAKTQEHTTLPWIRRNNFRTPMPCVPLDSER